MGKFPLCAISAITNLSEGGLVYICRYVDQLFASCVQRETIWDSLPISALI
jgi:hypothetical protein